MSHEYVNTEHCKECKKIYNKQYRLSNKEAIKKQALEYRLNNKEAIRKQRSEHRLSNKTKVRIRVTAYRNKTINQNRRLIRDMFGTKCEKCGSKEKLELDHIDPSTKIFNISSKIHHRFIKIVSELQKCQLLCQKCHLVKTKEDRNSIQANVL